MTDLPPGALGEDAANALERRELERRAYGPTSTPEEEIKSLAARRALHRMAQVSNPSLSPDLARVNVAPPKVEETPADFEITEIDHPTPRAGLRRALPFIAVAVVALAVGGLAGRLAPLSTPATSLSHASPAVGSPSMSITMPTQDQTASTIGRTWFSRKQQSSDKFMFYNAPQSVYQPSTVRLIATGAALGSVYIAKRAQARGGVCLLAWGPKAPDGSQAGSMGCASSSSFFAHGIVVNVDGDDGIAGSVARWTTMAITVSLDT